MRLVFSSARILLLTATFLIAAQLASAQEESEFDVNTPAIMLLQKSMAYRFMLLKPHLESGAVGLTHDGAIAWRAAALVDANALLTLDGLINEENKDRSTLYREIARANRRPEWESDLRITFGKRWISRIPTGWYYRDGSGQWQMK